MSADEFIAAFVSDVMEEAGIAVEYPRRQGLWRNDPFQALDKDFKKNFRLTKELAQNVMTLIEPVIIKKTEYDVKTKVGLS